LLDAIVIVQPETVIRWHRRGFRAYWHWKSCRVGGRPWIGSEIRALIRRMNRENPLWGAPRIHSELLMLGIDVAESTVGMYMVRRRRPPSKGWKTFLRNHAAGIASIDLFRRTHHLVQATLWPAHSSPCSPAAGDNQGDEQSGRRVDRGPGD